MKKKKSLAVKLIGGCALLVSLALMGYPLLSEWLFENRKDSIVETYWTAAEQLDDSAAEEELARAQTYNEELLSRPTKFDDPFSPGNKAENAAYYESLLNLQGNGVMGYLKIPCISVELPIYHSTSETVLQNGIGHLEGSSLPIGGESTHAVLTGHTGLNNARLFTDLNQVAAGDTFFIYVLNRKLAYEVDQVLVVEPQEVDPLTIESGMDYCTLVTCTPYGVNSHRLFVRGHRVEYKEELVEEAAQEVKAKPESNWRKQYKEAMFYGILTIIVILSAYEVLHRIRTRHLRKEKKDSLKEE